MGLPKRDVILVLFIMAALLTVAWLLLHYNHA
jgi:hypothetical protein